jgi:hypothetical protein
MLNRKTKMTTEKQINFPPLPKPASVSVENSDPGSVELRDNYTAQQMRDYVAADRAQRQAGQEAEITALNEKIAGWQCGAKTDAVCMIAQQDEIVALKASNADLLQALQKVIAISDRKHDAWDEARAALAQAVKS